MITAQAANWLGQCRTAALCWLGGRRQVISHNVAPKQTPFSLLLRVSMYTLLAEQLQSQAQKLLLPHYVSFLL